MQLNYIFWIIWRCILWYTYFKAHGTWNILEILQNLHLEIQLLLQFKEVMNISGRRLWRTGAREEVINFLH